MNKQLLQKLVNKSLWDEQSQIDVEDYIDLEKFAELIVKECAIIADEPSGRKPGYNIKKHFGVEE